MALIKLKQLDTILTGSLQVSGSSGVTGSLDVDTNIVAGNRVTSDYGTVNYSLVVNEAGHGGGDLRVESVNNAYQIFSDSNQDKVGIGTNSLTSLLTVNGDVTATHVTASGNISGSSTSTGSFGRLDSGDVVVQNALWFGDGDSGFAESSDDSIRVYTGGNHKWNFISDYFSANDTGAPRIVAGAGSAGAPVYGFNDDPNTGMYRTGADVIGFSANSTLTLEVAKNKISGSSSSTGSFGYLNVDGDTVIGGNLTIGDADTDSVSITADLTSNLTPDADITYDLGTVAKQWKDLYVGRALVGQTGSLHASSSLTVLMDGKAGMMLPSASSDPSGLGATEEGMMYFNTTDGLLKLFDGSAWIPAGDINTKNTHLTMSADIDANGDDSTIIFRIDGETDDKVKLRLKSDNAHEITGSANFSGSITATSAPTGSTTITTNNVTNGYPTSNQWQSSLEGSYFNNFDNTTHVSEILRFMSGVLSHSLDVADAAPNTKNFNSVDTNETSLGSTDSVDGYLPQSYDSSNNTMKYLVTKNWVAEGVTIFSGVSVYHDNGPTYYIDFDSNSGGISAISSSADGELFGLGGLTSGGATQFDVKVVATQSFSDTGSVASPDESSNTYTTQSFKDLSISSFGASSGLTLAKINTSQPAVIPAAYQDGKFADIGGISHMSGTLSRKYHASEVSFTSVSSSGYYNFHDLSIGIKTGSQADYVYKDGSNKNRFWAPIDQISSDIGTNSLTISQVTQSYLTATSRSLSGVPYLIGATYHISASIRGLFDPMYVASTTIVDDNISSVGVGSVAGSGMDDVSTSGGTISTAAAVWSSDSGSVRATSAVPTRTDVVRFNATYTLSGTTGENINQTGVSDSSFTVGVRGRNRSDSRSTLQTLTFLYHTGSSFGQPGSSGSMAVYQRSQGYDGGALTGTSEAFTGEDFRIKLNNDVLGFNGDAFDTAYNVSRAGSDRVIGEQDLQVKPGFLVNPSGSYSYWFPDNYGSGSYKYYIRRFQTSGTKTSMTVDVGATLVNWDASTANSVAAALLFKSSASGSGTNSELSTARIYDPSELTSNAISSSVARDNFKNPFSSALNLYGNTGGSKSSTEYTLPIRNADGMYLDSNDNELYVILRYKGNPTPVTGITLTFS